MRNEVEQIRSSGNLQNLGQITPMWKDFFTPVGSQTLLRKRYDGIAGYLGHVVDFL